MHVVSQVTLEKSLYGQKNLNKKKINISKRQHFEKCILFTFIPAKYYAKHSLSDSLFQDKDNNCRWSGDLNSNCTNGSDVKGTP